MEKSVHDLFSFESGPKLKGNRQFVGHHGGSWGVTDQGHRETSHLINIKGGETINK